MTHITRVSFQLKGIEAEYDLKRRQIFMGENRQGKTTIRDAIELACYGKHHIGDRPSEAIELFGPDDDEIRVALEGQHNGEEWHASYIRTMTGGKPATVAQWLAGVGTDILSTIIPPIGNQLKGDRLAREALFARFGPTDLADPKGMSEKQREAWRAAAESIDQGLDAGARLAALASHFRSAKNSLGREIGADERQLETLRESVGEGAGAEELPGIERRLSELTDRDDPDELNETVRKLRRAAIETSGKIDVIETKIARAKTVVELGKCKMCGRGADPKLIERAKKAIPRREVEARKLRTEMQAIQRRADDLADRIDEIRSLENQIAELREASGDVRQIDAVAMALEDKRDRQQLMKDLERIATKTMTSALDETRNRAEQAVNAAMIDGFSARLEFDAKKCAWCAVDESGRPRRRTTSGSESAALLIGLHVAWGASVLFLDDSDIGTITCGNLTNLCEALDRAITDKVIEQAILVVDPDRESRIPGARWAITNIE